MNDEIRMMDESRNFTSHQIRNMFGDRPFLLIFKELWGCNYILVKEFKH